MDYGDGNWPSWQHWDDKFQLTLLPIFTRHKRDLIDLLQRPRAVGGAGLDRAGAEYEFWGAGRNLWGKLESQLSLSYETLSAEVFYMHVCDQGWGRTSSKFSLAANYDMGLAASKVPPLIRS